MTLKFVKLWLIIAASARINYSLIGPLQVSKIREELQRKFEGELKFGMDWQQALWDYEMAEHKRDGGSDPGDSSTIGDFVKKHGKVASPNSGTDMVQLVVDDPKAMHPCVDWMTKRPRPSFKCGQFQRLARPNSRINLPRRHSRPVKLLLRRSTRAHLAGAFACVSSSAHPCSAWYSSSPNANPEREAMPHCPMQSCSHLN